MPSFRSRYIKIVNFGSLLRIMGNDTPILGYLKGTVRAQLYTLKPWQIAWPPLPRKKGVKFLLM